MNDCPEIAKLIQKLFGDDVVGFFERKLITSEQEVRVFIPVYNNTKPYGLVNQSKFDPTDRTRKEEELKFEEYQSAYV